MANDAEIHSRLQQQLREKVTENADLQSRNQDLQRRILIKDRELAEYQLQLRKKVNARSQNACLKYSSHGTYLVSKPDRFFLMHMHTVYETRSLRETYRVVYMIYNSNYNPLSRRGS